jgi:hypothetical protein
MGQYPRPYPSGLSSGSGEGSTDVKDGTTEGSGSTENYQGQGGFYNYGPGMGPGGGRFGAPRPYFQQGMYHEGGRGGRGRGRGYQKEYYGSNHYENKDTRENTNAATTDDGYEKNEKNDKIFDKQSDKPNEKSYDKQPYAKKYDSYQEKEFYNSKDNINKDTFKEKDTYNDIYPDTKGYTDNYNEKNSFKSDYKESKRRRDDDDDYKVPLLAQLRNQIIRGKVHEWKYVREMCQLNEKKKVIKINIKNCIKNRIRNRIKNR